MKFGGTSVGDARRMLAVTEIVRERGEQRPVVVVSALAGVTDLLEHAIEAARSGDRESLEQVLADLERRHRWAVAGAIDRSASRHDLNLVVDALFDELRQLLRSVRVLGEVTPRAHDVLMAFGETLSARIVTAVMAEQGLPTEWVDPRDVVVTDARHGSASVDLDATRERAAETLGPLLDGGTVPVLGGFVGATRDGETTTLGRGGSDTTAAALGCVLEAAEIQIWTDVPGMMTADPRMVPAARTLPQVSFAEAAELAFHGARVLHPAAIAPAVRRRIPVRVLAAADPAAPGTRIVEDPAADAPPLAAVAWRGGVRRIRVTSRTLRVDAGFLPRVLDAFADAGCRLDLVVASEIAATVVAHGGEIAALRARLEGVALIEIAERVAIVTVVGHGLAADPAVRGEVLAALTGVEPELVSLGGSPRSVSVVLPEPRAGEAVARLHRRFFEQGG